MTIFKSINELLANILYNVSPIWRTHTELKMQNNKNIKIKSKKEPNQEYDD